MYLLNILKNNCSNIKKIEHLTFEQDYHSLQGLWLLLDFSFYAFSIFLRIVMMNILFFGNQKEIKQFNNFIWKLWLINSLLKTVFSLF